MEPLVNSLIGLALLVFDLLRGLLEWGDNALLIGGAVTAGAYLGTRAALTRHGHMTEFVVLGGFVPELLCASGSFRHAGTTDVGGHRLRGPRRRATSPPGPGGRPVGHRRGADGWPGRLPPRQATTTGSKT